MKSQLMRGNIVVKKSQIHGYGVFAAQDFASGEVIEECHVLQIGNDASSLKNYYFTNPLNEQLLLPLGYGVIYNHNAFPNANFLYDSEYHLLGIKALRKISKGEEITIHYSDNWFTSRKIKEVVVKPGSAWRLVLLAVRAGLAVVSIYILIAVLSHSDLPIFHLF